jgi:hypothetical protein
MQQNKTWYIRFDKETGRILAVGPRTFSIVNDNHAVIESTNQVCRDLVSGSRNMTKYAVHWDEVNSKWDVDVKSSVIELKTIGDKLNQFKVAENPSLCDLFMKIIRNTNKIVLNVNFLSIRQTLNLGQINSIKNEYTNLLDLYICKRNDPDRLIGVVPIDAIKLFTKHRLSINVPADILKHINSWDDISLFTKPVFKTYGLEFTDVDEHGENKKLHKVTNTTDTSHINMYVLNNKLIIDSTIDKDNKYYFGNKNTLQMHVSNKYIDNYITTLTISTNRLLNNKIEIDLPSNWPENPVFTFKNTELTVNYYGEKNE